MAHEDSLNLAFKVLLVGNRLMPCEFTNLAKFPYTLGIGEDSKNDAVRLSPSKGLILPYI